MQRHGREADRRKLPQHREFGRGVDAALKAGQRVALAAQDPAVVGAKERLADGRPALDELVLGAAGAQHGGDVLARGPVGGHDAQFSEEQWTMLYVERAAQFDRIDLGRPARRLSLVLFVNRRGALLPALELLLGAALEPRWRRRERELNQTRSARGLHGGEQTVYERGRGLTWIGNT